MDEEKEAEGQYLLAMLFGTTSTSNTTLPKGGLLPVTLCITKQTKQPFQGIPLFSKLDSLLRSN